MIDTFELFEELSGSVNTQQGGHVRPNRNFIQWVNAISLGLFEEKFAAWEKSQKITDDLSRPFLKSANVAVTAAGPLYGIVKFPEDYAHFSAARHFTQASTGAEQPLVGLATYDCCGKVITPEMPRPLFIDPAIWALMIAAEPKQTIDPPPTLAETTIDLVDNGRWGACLEHRFLRPTTQDPKMTQFEGGFKIAPASVTTIVLDYLRLPALATFEYSVFPGNPQTGKGDYLVYDKATSKPLEWSSLIRNEILIRLDKKFGKYIREDFIWQVSESDRKQTV